MTACEINAEIAKFSFELQLVFGRRLSAEFGAYVHVCVFIHACLCVWVACSLRRNDLCAPGSPYRWLPPALSRKCSRGRYHLDCILLPLGDQYHPDACLIYEHSK